MHYLAQEDPTQIPQATVRTQIKDNLFWIVTNWELQENEILLFSTSDLCHLSDLGFLGLYFIALHSMNATAVSPP